MEDLFLRLLLCVVVIGCWTRADEENRRRREPKKERKTETTTETTTGVAKL
jgi:hypothetical protein